MLPRPGKTPTSSWSKRERILRTLRILKRKAAGRRNKIFTRMACP
jgi:hypothetical protein